VPLADVGAELLFQVIADRSEKAAVIPPTNLPVLEWTLVIPNARLCKALFDCITDRAHIIGNQQRVIPLPSDLGEAERKGIGKRGRITLVPGWSMLVLPKLAGSAGHH